MLRNFTTTMLGFGHLFLVLVCLSRQATSNPIVEMRIKVDGAVGGTIDISPNIDADVGITDNLGEILDGDINAGVGSDVDFGNDIGSDIDISAEVDDDNALDGGLFDDSRADEEDYLNSCRPARHHPNIAFSVYLTTVLKATCDKHVVMFDKPMLKGKEFDFATGMFTAPNTGVYQFTFVISQATVGVSRAHLIRKVNGRAYNVVDATAEGTKEGLRVQGTNTAILKLLAGNQVYVEMDAGSTLDGDRYTTFSGHLLYTC